MFPSSAGHVPARRWEKEFQETSIHSPMFVVDYISAFLLAVAFTIAFASAVRDKNYRAWRNMPAKVWLLAVGSWMGGMLVVGLGAVVAHWLTFLLGVIALAVIVFALIRVGPFRETVHTETGNPGDDARPAIALYFCVTLLLFFCAISFRFYVVNLS
ncbi:MAG: hypothetical protein H0W20_10480 [Chthoniobacterales bacterium]|nr:hypothetical protein [Chthoniobacterales bacterium]